MLGFRSSPNLNHMQLALPRKNFASGALARLKQLAGLVRPAVRGLDLQIGNIQYSFHAPRDFEFALAGKIAVPVTKFTELLKLPADELLREGKAIRKVEKQFVQVLEQCLEEPTLVGGLLRDLGTKLFSKDHNWRDIINGLNSAGPRGDEYKKIALVKYMQYLASRQEVLNMLYAQATDRRVEENDELSSEAEPPQGIGMKSTVIFDLMQIEDSHRFVNPFERLPRGQTVNLRIAPGDSVDIMLSKHKFSLIAGDPCVLVDPAGKRSALRSGKNRIGRHVDNDVPVDTAYRSVSRKHLIVEPMPGDLVRLTDLSAHGTFVPPEYVSASTA